MLSDSKWFTDSIEFSPNTLSYRSTCKINNNHLFFIKHKIIHGKHNVKVNVNVGFKEKHNSMQHCMQWLDRVQQNGLK